jgi:phosphotriesterase-related protein
MLCDAAHSASLSLPREAGAKGRALSPLTMENMWHVRQHRENVQDNQKFDEDEAIAEVLLYKRAGGQSFVDATTVGFGRDPLTLVRIARATGVNIVMAAGYYTMEVPQPGLDRKTEDEITAEIVHDIEEGFGWPAVRAGIIGEIGCSWPLHANERKVLRAAARAQQHTGAALLIHPGRDQQAPMEIIGILEEAGADVTRTIIGHLDRTLPDQDRLAELAETGCYLEYDLFGQEYSDYPWDRRVDMPNDAKRVDHLLWLIERGHLAQLVVASDMDNKWESQKYGGPGLGHLIQNVVPVMLRKGMTEDQLQDVLVRNPARLLAFA